MRVRFIPATADSGWISAALTLVLALSAGGACAADDGLARATPEEVGLDREPLVRLGERIQADSAINIHSVLVARGGKLVFEAYFSGSDEDWGNQLGKVEHGPDVRHDLRSVTKSITSALIGIAIDEGRVPGLQATAFELLPDYARHMAPDKKQLTLHHILSMTAGLDWFEPWDYTNPGNDEIRLIESPDPVAFVIGRSFESRPGETFEYNGGLPTLLGYLLEQAYGRRGDEIIREKLFEPLGIESFDFRANDSGMLAYASGLRLTSRDMMKVGLMYLNGGNWEGRQVLPESWVRASLTPYVSTPWTAGYGYQWWIQRYRSDAADFLVPSAVGNGGQRIIVVQPLDMVVVITAGNYNQVDVPLTSNAVMTDYVFPAAGLQNLELVLETP
jgi:CubicO group peptidase (beta-lactamase class C family)